MNFSRIHISQLINDEELRSVVERTGCGLELVDFSMASVLDDLDSQLMIWKKKLKYIAPEGLSLHGPFLDLNPTAWDRLIADATMRRFEEAYKAASVLGAHTIVFHSCFVPNFNFLQGWPERVIDFYNRFLDGKDGSIRILMENVMDPVPDGFLEVAKGMDHPAFGICVDIGHAHCYSKVTADEWLSVLAPYVKHVHIHDNDGTRDSHLALGNGTMEFAKAAELIPEGATCTVECSYYDDVMNSIEALREYI